jgi:hypothetical protein
MLTAVQEMRLREREEQLRQQQTLDEERRRIQTLEDTERSLVGSERRAALRRRLQELWTVLETPDTERARFLWVAEDVTPFEERSQQTYTSEIERLTTQLPLMEAVTRYEFNKYRLCVIDRSLLRAPVGTDTPPRREFGKAAADPQRLLAADGGALIRDERARKEVRAACAPSVCGRVSDLGRWRSLHDS